MKHPLSFGKHDLLADLENMKTRPERIHDYNELDINNRI